MARDNQPGLFRQAPLPIAALGEAERLACLRLIRSENVGPVTFRELINHFGGAERALEALPDLTRRTRRGRSIAICPRDRAEAELAAASRHGATTLFTIEPGFPSALAHVAGAPPMLYVKGRSELLDRDALAVVGARNGSAAGMSMARLLAGRAGAEGYVVVSGLARGIDRAAHEATLATGTVAVLAGGIDFVYPPDNADLHQRIAREGCLVTEMPPGFQPRGQDFPRRNRIISGIALAVVVVEAARRSGSLITAHAANEQGRVVMAVPGHPLDPRAEGPNRLIKSGATMVTSAEDVLEVLAPMRGNRAARGGMEEAMTGPASAIDVPVAAPSRLSYVPEASPPPAASEDASRAVLAVLSPSPVTFDEVARASGLPVRIARGALLELALAGHIEHHGGQLVSLKTPISQSD